ncbi:hypothetical protein FWI69_06390 [Francisella tularensis subsp. holarctica]|nr:hypothetical protein [Francisella tularensis subsp. holarctica]
MTIKIFPEKVANIPTHTTRKKITNTTYASKQLISKAAHLKTTIEVANKELYKLDLPYLRAVSNTNLRANEPSIDLVCGLLLEKKK